MILQQSCLGQVDNTIVDKVLTKPQRLGCFSGSAFISRASLYTAPADHCSAGAVDPRGPNAVPYNAFQRVTMTCFVTFYYFVNTTQMLRTRLCPSSLHVNQITQLSRTQHFEDLVSAGPTAPYASGGGKI